VGAFLTAVRLRAGVTAPCLGVPVGHQAKRVIQRLGYIPQISDNLAGPGRACTLEKHGYSLYSGISGPVMVWREREGVEPTTDCAGSPPSGFEARGAHRDPSAPKGL